MELFLDLYNIHKVKITLRIKLTLPEVHTESDNSLARYLSPLNRSDSMYQALLIQTLQVIQCLHQPFNWTER